MIAAIYARKSTDQSDVSEKQKSVERQIEHARGYAVSKGWTVADDCVFIDDGVSGAEFARRPGFLRLMNALKPRPRFQVLVMAEESRLGREAIETAYALKQIITAGVRVFFYLENRERTLETPTDKLLMSVTAFADELERDKARQRTYDAMVRRARAGHVTGGRLFGYDNVEVLGPDGKRSHVDRRINEGEARVIRRIFELSAHGRGMKSIAKLLNDAGEPSPRAQRGRSRTWAPSSVREVLFRSTYRGVVTWNLTRKRDAWGQHRQSSRPATEWMEREAPHLRIVSDAEWQAAHLRLNAARAIYLRGTIAKRFGRPALGAASPYLLTSFAECAVCGSTMKVLTRHHGRRRGRFYGCAGYHDRGKSVCANGRVLPMDDADRIVLEAILDDVLRPDLLWVAVDQALQTLTAGADDDKSAGARLRRQLDKLEAERGRLVDAIAGGADVASLVTALRERESSIVRVRAEYDRLQAMPAAVDGAKVRAELEELASDWKRLLMGEPEHARPLLSALLVGRLKFRPQERPNAWELFGRGSIAGLFSRVVDLNFPLGMASPTGFEPVF